MLEGIAPCIGVTTTAIKDTLNDTQPIPVTIEKIINEVARTYNVIPSDIRGKKRSAKCECRPPDVDVYHPRDHRYEHGSHSVPNSSVTIPTVVYSIQIRWKRTSARTAPEGDRGRHHEEHPYLMHAAG